MRKASVREVASSALKGKLTAKNRAVTPVQDSASQVFGRIFDPKNRHLFSVDASLAAFSHLD